MPSAGIQMGNKGNQGSKVPIGIGPNIVAAIQHLLWHSWVLYFISVFIIICGWPRLPVVDKLWMSFWSFGAAVAQLALLSLPFGICFFFYRLRLRLRRRRRRPRPRRQEQRQRRCQLPAIVLISVALS